MTFEGKPWIIPIYTDKSHHIVIRKSVQCGISEWLTIRTIAKAEQGFSTFYVLPKYELRNTFVANRIDKLINMVPYYRQLMKDSVGEADSSQIKHIGQGTAKFASSNTFTDFLEFPAHQAIVDELDKCAQEHLPYVNDRLKAANPRDRYTVKVANPSIDGWGISLEYKDSDQKAWTVPCETCGEYQELDFFKVVVQESEEGQWQLRDRDWVKGMARDIHCVCSRCGGALERLSIKGRWHVNNPGSEVSGYHITRLMDGNTTVQELWKTFVSALGNETKMQAFYNSDLGIPYSSKGAKLTEYLIDQCRGDYAMPSIADGCVMGVDVGAVLHVKISHFVNGKRRAVCIQTVPNFEDLDILIRLYGVECCVIDALPETHKAREFRDRQQGKVWLCEFHSQEGNTKEIKLNEDEYRVSCDRTQSIDEAHADVLRKQIELPRDAGSIDGGAFYAQMCAPTRVFDEDKKRFVWKEGSKADHYRMADVYEKVAATIKDKMGVHVWAL